MGNRNEISANDDQNNLNSKENIERELNNLYLEGNKHIMIDSREINRTWEIFVYSDKKIFRNNYLKTEKDRAHDRVFYEKLENR